MNALYSAPLPAEIQASSVRSIHGTLNVPMPRTSFVHASGAQTSDESALASAGLFYTSVNAALADVTANKSERIICLPGHTEDVGAADHWANLVAGVDIIGWGSGTLRPTLTWSAATSTILLNVANVNIRNFIMEFAGDPAASTALTVAAPITVSAAGCGIYDCDIDFGVDADQIITAGIATTAAGDNFTFNDNFCHGATAAEVQESFLELVGADNLVMRRNYIQGATDNVAVGIVRFATTASLNIRSEHNYFGNLKALSTCAVTGLAAVSGVSMHDHFHYLDAASLTPWLTSTGIMSFHRPTVSNTAGETGSEVVGTVSA